MRIFARLAFLCNLCFIASVILRLVEISRHVKASHTDKVELNPFISSIVVLGLIAIFINIIFTILFLSRFAKKRMNNIPRWIVYCNLILLPMQVYYFFFSKF